MYDDQPLDHNKLKYASCVRKSTENQDRQVRSIDDQIADCRDYEERIGLNVIGKPLVERKSAKCSNFCGSLRSNTQP